MKSITAWLSKKSKKVQKVNSQGELDSETLSEISANSDSMIVTKKNHLVLDLDETLFHSQTTKEKTHKHAVKFDYHGKEMQYYVAARPGLLEFLEEMQKYYVLNVYTCSDLSYAEAILTKIGAKEYFKRIFSRANCKRHEDQSLSKDLSVLGVELSDVVFIDDLERHIKENSSNGLKIVAYHGEKKDTELKKLAAFLKKLAFCPDVRSVSERHALFQAGKSIITENDLLLKEASLASEKMGRVSPSKLSEEEESSQEEDKVISKISSPVEVLTHSVFEMKYPEVFFQREIACA